MTQDPQRTQSLPDMLVGTGASASAVLDDASLLQIAGTSGLAGEYQGEDAILGLFERMGQLTNGTYRFIRSRVLTSDDRAIVVCVHSSATRRGKYLDADAVHVFSLRDNRVREMWIFHLNQDQVDDFWTDPARS